MTLLDDTNSNPRGKWGWWGDPNVTDEMIVDYEMRNKNLNLPGLFGGMGPGIDQQYGYIPGRNSRMPTIFGGMGPRIDEQYGYIPGVNNGFGMGTEPFGRGIMPDLAGRYGLWGNLGKIIGGGLGKLFGK